MRSALVEEDDAAEDGIRYAHNGGVAIAYQVVGEGDIDLVYVPDWMSNLVYGWESPRWRAFYERLAQSFRLILDGKAVLSEPDRTRAVPEANAMRAGLRAHRAPPSLSPSQASAARSAAARGRLRPTGCL